MSTLDRLAALSQAAERELRENILPFWATKVVDREEGGFYGQMTNELKVDHDAAKGGVLNARILWTFSAALRRWPEPLYREMAERAFVYLLEHFWDPQHSGLVWLVDHRGQILDGHKQTYCQAFGIYGLAEYYRATGTQEALDRAIKLFEDVERYAFEPKAGGYNEARGRDWQPIEDVSLSPKDMNAPYSMNTHLHLLEAYATLSLAWDDERPRERLRALLEILLERIIDQQSGHLILFQDEEWRPLAKTISYGHEIETSWLLCEAADVLEDSALIKRAETAGLEMAESVLGAGYDAENGGVFNEAEPDGHFDTNKDWWPQAEAVVGFLNAYQLSGQSEFLEAADQTWGFIDGHVIDRVYGEWYSKLTREGKPFDDVPKIEFWKCPYHNSRAAIEIIERTQKLIQSYPS